MRLETELLPLVGQLVADINRHKTDGHVQHPDCSLGDYDLRQMWPFTFIGSERLRSLFRP